MHAKHNISTVTVPNLQDLCQDYPTIIPEKLTELDELRYVTIPRHVSEFKSTTDAFLTLEQVTTLVDWKLSHGTFRPSLKKLVAQNSDADVRVTTAAAFRTLAASSGDIANSLKELVKLRGIGPATASLLLSVFDPSQVPFFSDELFRWCFWDGARGAGWDRVIKYTAKEYHELVLKVHELQVRLERASGTRVAAVDIEKAAYVLGKRDAGVQASTTSKSQDRDRAEQPRKRESQEEDQPSSTVRKKVKAEGQSADVPRRNAPRHAKKA